MCYTFFLSFSFSSKTIFLYLFYSNFWSRQLSRYLYTQIYVDVLSWSNVKITLVLFSSQDKCVCEEDTCWKHQYIDRYWLIRERWAVSLMSTPLRNLSRQTAKYLETKFIRMMIIWSTGDLYEKKSSMNVNWIRCVYTFRLFFFFKYIWRKQIDDVRIIKFDFWNKRRIFSSLFSHCLTNGTINNKARRINYEVIVWNR
jgi:hypothetical protein